MPIVISGTRVETNKAVFKELGKAEPEKYANDVKSSRISLIENVSSERSLGSIDATSCINAIYSNSKGILVQHVDDRDDLIFKEIFRNKFPKEEPVNVTLVGGYRVPDASGNFSHDYGLIERDHTRINFNTIVNMWSSLEHTIDVKGWVIGDSCSNATLASDFYADKKGNISLLAPGLMYNNNRIPEIIHRAATTLNDTTRYRFVYDQTKSEKLELEPLPPGWKNPANIGFVNTLKRMSAQEITNRFSTSPLLEPPHFGSLYNSVGKYVSDWLSNLSNPNPSKSVELPEGPVMILQGEIGYIKV